MLRKNIGRSSDQEDNEKLIEDDKTESNIALNDEENCSESENDSANESQFLKEDKLSKQSLVKKKTNKPTGSLKQERQNILLSATLTHAVEKLAGLTMQNPVFVDAAKENIEEYSGDMTDVNEDLVVPDGVAQTYVVTPPKLRAVTLSAYIAGKCQVNIYICRR